MQHRAASRPLCISLSFMLVLLLVPLLSCFPQTRADDRGRSGRSLRNRRGNTVPDFDTEPEEPSTEDCKSSRRAQESTTIPEFMSVQSSNSTTNSSEGGGTEETFASIPEDLIPVQNYPLEPARVSCNAQYSSACARANAQFLAVATAQKISEILLNSSNTDGLKVWEDLNAGKYNMASGFYPFVFDAETSICVAKGEDTNHVGLTLQEVLQEQGNGFSDAGALLERFVSAAEHGGAWVQYLWKDAGRTHTKLAFIVKVYVSATNYQILGVGYGTEPAPADVPCSAQQDGWCSISNTLSLVGKAQLRLFQSESIAQFETAMYELSFNQEEFQIQGGFYVFMYHYDGRLKAHGLIHDHFNDYAWDVIEDHGLGTKEEGQALHRRFINAAESSGWIQYKWRNSPDDPETFTKVSFAVKIEFGGENYIMGAGFKFESSMSPGDEECSDDYNLPCSFRMTLELSSHVVTHAISSSLPVQDIWDAVTYEDRFRRQDFYAYAFDFNGTCVSHILPSFIGYTVSDIVDLTGMELENPPTAEGFVNAAKAGGGWYMYDWGSPGEGPNGTDILFKKIAYIFYLNVDGREYYGGVGFTDNRAPVSLYTEEGARLNGLPISCSQNYSLPCSEINTEAILGQALSDLTLASSAATGKEESLPDLDISLILESITVRNSAYRVNDFHVAVFSIGGDECALQDGSGCCIAHGNDPNLVGKTWQQILDEYKITSIQGDDLHNDLITESNNIGGSLEYPWSREFGEAQTKIALTSRYEHKQQYFYIVTEYFKSPLPDTCDSCPSDLECTRDFQSFCEPIPDKQDGPLEWIIALCALLGISLILFYWIRHKNWVKQQALDKKIKAMEEQIQGMVEISQDTGAQIPTAQKYFEMFGMVGDDYGRGTKRSNVHVFWYWEEDVALLQRHDSTMVLPGTTFVRYADEISMQLEDAYQLLLQGEGYYEITLDLAEVASKVHNAQTGLQFQIDFEEMTQANPVTEHRRAIRREEIPIQLDEELVQNLPPLPGDVDFFGDDGETYLPTFKGQVIQVSKEHPSLPWIYGSILYDPLLDAAQDQPQAAAGLNQILSNALHDRPTSGWFPKALSLAADVKVMQNLLVTLGGDGVKNLKPPDTWDDKEGIIPVLDGSAEYDEVMHYFLAALYDERDNVEVVGVERIQSMPLWQSYAVKKQTMKTRDSKNPGNLVNNRDLNGLERKWLFHGTRSDAISQIVKQGFNRAFAGRNAVLFGRGVYFARDASYSSHRAYSQPDSDGTQWLFMCRVAVGDWCQGAEGMLTPATKPNSNLELFDTTVDDVTNPSVFVVYHDSQAYPDYLISFKRNDS